MRLMSQPTGRITSETGEVLRPGDLGDCSIAAALEVLGDTWSVLVLRELFFGVRRFNDIQTELGISRSVLSDRLARLADHGIVRTVPYQEPGSRVRHEYRLTRKGVGLLPLVVALKEWGDQHVQGGEGPVVLLDTITGDEVRLELRTTGGRRVEPNEISPQARAGRGAAPGDRRA
jgi:DNA-binding HxlR family transcriptional regulator